MDKLDEIRDRFAATDKLRHSDIEWLLEHVNQLHRERLVLAKLAAKEPQFLSPVAAWEAVALRDEILDNLTTANGP